MDDRSDEQIDAADTLRHEVAEREKAEQALLRRLEMERLVAETSKRFINLAPERFDQEVKRTLQRIGRFARADRAYVFQLRNDGKLKDNTHEWCAPGIAPELEQLQGLPVDDFPWWMDPLRRLEEVHISQVAQLPLEAEFERQHLIEQQIQSLVLVPMAWEGALVGFLGFDAVRTAKEWRREDTTLLRTIGDVLVAALQRRRTEAALHEAEVRVHQLQKMEAVGQLAGGMAHDFNNLLAVIDANARFVAEALDRDHPALPDVKEISLATHRAADLVRQLLAFARRQLLQPEVLSLNSIVGGVTQMLRRLIGENIALDVSLDPELRLVKADPGQMEQVVINLAVNARDAMPRGGRLTITTANLGTAPPELELSADLEPGPWATLTLSDTGTGMDEETRSRIFEPFFTTKEAGLGTGLGLSTVYGIVTQSGGDIVVRSAVEAGSTFTVILPTVAEPERARQTDPSRTAAPQPTETVLLIEDEPLVRRTLVRTLSSKGYVVLQAGNGEEALAVAEQHGQPIHLVLSDVILPGMSGPECCDRLRSIRPTIAVVYMSGYADDAIVRQGVEDSATPLLRKPFSREALLDVVRTALDE